MFVMRKEVEERKETTKQREAVVAG
jgi:hypothetical protein